MEDFTSKQVFSFKTRLAHTNEEVSAYNNNMLLKNGTTLITVKGNHNTKKARKMSNEEFGGL